MPRPKSTPEKSAVPKRNSPASVPPERLDLLNRGLVETSNLAEALALDIGHLLAVIHKKISKAERERMLAETAYTRRMAVASRILHESGSEAIWASLEAHPSDTVRCWGAGLVGHAEGITLKERVRRIRPYADDPHFGVREWAWMVVRPHLALELPQAIKLMTPWTKEKSPNLRRFAVESLRPRGVWCVHITPLKEDPQLGLPLLEPLRADPTKYVQDSVSNWLNDAAKTRPDWVQELCARWQLESPTPATQRICKRAVRSIK